MNKNFKINDTLNEDALALESLFRSAGLEAHARAVRIALEEAKNDIILEKYCGTDHIYKIFNSAINLNKTITASLKSDNLTNKKMIDLLDNHLEDINNIQDIKSAPKFVKSNNIPILQTVASLIQHIKTQDPDTVIDNKTRKILQILKKFTGGDS